MPAAAEVTARRYRVASPAIWIGVLGGLAALSLAAMIPLSLLAGQVFNGAIPLVIGVPCAGVGILVARRQPRNPIGWLFLVTAACLFLSTDGPDYALLQPIASGITFRWARWARYWASYGAPA